MKKSKVYIQYTIVFVILFGLSYISFIKLGKSFIWNIDGFEQHYIILEDFNNMIRNIFSNGIQLFSWNMGLGLDVIGQYSYYILGDPFAYLSILFPMRYLKYVYQILIILRIYCVGISFIIYCKYNKKEDFNTLIGALIYTFSGYMIYASIRHPYFTNPVIMLPLVFIGIDKILKEDKYIFFIGTIAVLAIMNYYFLYMVTILAFIYAIVRYIIEYRQNGIKEFGIKFLKTFLCYIIGVMIAGIILLPTIYAFMCSDRSGVNYTHYTLQYYEKLLFGQPDTPFWSKSYVCSIVLLILPISILNIKNNKENKENKVILVNILISIIMLLIPFIGSVMNGFSFQSNRWIFGFSFYMAYMVVLNLNKDVKYSVKEIIYMLAVLIIYMIAALIVPEINKTFVLISIGISALMIAVFIVRSIWGDKKETLRKLCKALIFILILVNIVVYAWSVYSPNAGKYVEQFITTSKVEKKYNNYKNKIKSFNKAIKYIRKQDDSFYRIGTPIYYRNNMPIKHKYKGMNSYLSIGNGYVSKLSKDLLILGKSKTDALNELDSRTKITTLLGCKYYIVPDEKQDYVPYGYELIKEYKKTKIYENKNDLSVGVFYDNYILNKDYEKLTALEKEQALLDTAVIQDEEQIKNSDILYNQELEEQIKANIINEVQSKIINKVNINKGCTFDVVFDEIDKSELYIYFENLKYYGDAEYLVKTSYDGVEKKQEVRNKISSAYYEDTPNILINLGYKSKHKGKINVKLSTDGTYSFDNIKVIAVPMENYKNSIKKLKENTFELKEYGNNYMKGSINNNKDGILQISTSYSKGWKAIVDGKEQEVINVNEGFIGIVLKEGNHEIYFKYSTPWLKTGSIVSGLGILVLIIIVIKSRKGKNEI